MKFAHCLTVVLVFQANYMGNCDGDLSDKLPAFGRDMRKEFFMEPDFTFLNHGSYGTYPKAVSRALHQYQKISEQNPDQWLRRDLWPQLQNVRDLLAALINSDSEDIVMVPNTTDGMNSILRSIVFQFGERILHLNTIYASMGSIIQYLVDNSDGAISKVVFNVTYPLSNEKLLQSFEDFLDEIHDPAKPIRIALIDHISSVPAMVNPIDKIIPMLKKRNITVLIDGAHAIGQVPINIKALQPDYYVSNAHKWLYAARGCAFLYVDKKLQSTIHPAHINAAYKQPANFQSEFSWIGTMDYSMYMTVPAALEFRKKVGGEDAIMEYNHNLAYEGGLLMAARFQTKVLQSKDQIGSMVDVQLPIENPDNPKLVNPPSWWVDIQLNKYPQTFAPVYKHNGLWYTRVSAQIYNDLSDFKLLADHFITIIKSELEEHDNSTVLAANFLK